ncbi:MAG: hypothetical protein IKX03_02090 [Bacteroidales bacterium]|nr:hypothetical protein [Bacteroidales bacterium]MBR5055964.1 hypothetical protein [Bacteroidales bacterium]
MREYIDAGERVSREAVEGVIGITREILDNLAISGDNPQLLARKLKRAIFSTDGDDRGLVASVEKLADFYYFGIAGYLRENCPSLSDDEVRMCCFICMNLPNHSLQYLFGYGSTAYLYNQRSKIRHKLGIDDPDITLERYLEGIVERLRQEKEAEENFSFNKRNF